MKPETMPETAEVLAFALGRLRPGMVKWATARTQCPDLAEEAVQQALLKALERLPSLREPKHLSSWFRTIVKNVLTDELRRRQSLASLEDRDADTPMMPVSESESQSCACILNLMEQIKPDYASLLQAVDVQEQSLSGAAADLGISANNAGVRLHRARKALRRQLATTCGTDSIAACQDCGCS